MVLREWPPRREITRSRPPQIPLAVARVSRDTSPDEDDCYRWPGFKVLIMSPRHQLRSMRTLQTYCASLSIAAV